MKTRSHGKILEKLVYTLENIILIKILYNISRIFICIKSRPNWQRCQVKAETMSVGQILEKPCVHSRGRKNDPMFMKPFQNIYLNDI